MWILITRALENIVLVCFNILTAHFQLRRAMCLLFDRCLTGCYKIICLSSTLLMVHWGQYVWMIKSKSWSTKHQRQRGRKPGIYFRFATSIFCSLKNTVWREIFTVAKPTAPVFLFLGCELMQQVCRTVSSNHCGRTASLKMKIGRLSCLNIIPNNRCTSCQNQLCFCLKALFLLTDNTGGVCWQMQRFSLIFPSLCIYVYFILQCIF